MLLNCFFIVLGFLLLIKGGDWLVDGATNIARWARLSSMIIGITVIGFGTSMPELLVSLQAAFAGSSGLSIGNVVGSNIANIALILGVTALMIPCVSKRFTLKVDMPMMVFSCLALSAVGISGCISRLAGMIGVFILLLFILWEIRLSRKRLKGQEVEKPKLSLWKAIVLALFSFGLLLLGANVLIKGAVGVARELGVEERIIGLTIVAVGTSLPELFASIMAAYKKESEMAVGNIIGSVTFNNLCGIGLTASICPIMESDKGFLCDYAIMSALALLLWLFMRTRHLLERWEGAVLLSSYILYIIWTL